MNILFWNIAGHDVSRHIAACAMEQHADVICLAEHRAVDPRRLCELLKGYKWVNDKAGCDAIRLFARPTVVVVDQSERDRFIVCLVECERERYILSATHLPDRRNNPTPEKRCRILRSLVAEARALENVHDCTNSIVIGDLNANPFDPELTSLDTLNATLFRDVIARLGKRTSYGRECPLMYNPVLDSLRDDPDNNGSYYVIDGTPPIYWHCLDQVVVSASLAGRVISMRYLREIGGESIVGNAGPRRDVSDHLPLITTIARRNDE